MPLTVLSAVIAVDTRFKTDLNLNNKSIDDKCNFLSQCAQAAAHSFATLCPTGIPRGSLKFLLAPEYFFGLPQGGAGSPVNAYSDADKANIVGQCQAISARFPDVLMLPGTLLYKRRVGRAERRAIAADLQQQQNIYNRMGAGQKTLAVRAGVGVQDISLKGLGVKEALGLRDPKLLGYNAALVYYGGRLIETFNKADNASEFSAENPKPTLVPGVGANTFQYPGTNVPVGVEVCADHGRLRQANQNVRIQLLVSAAINVSLSSVAVPANGMLISCNGGTQTMKDSGIFLPMTTGAAFQQTGSGTFLDTQADRTRNAAVELNGSVRCQRADLT